MNEPKQRVILFGSEGCGYGDKDLGFEILTNLLEALANREDRPAAIICWNTAVRMVAQDSPLLSRLKRLEEKSVSILSGRSCLVDLGIEDKVAVGKIATMGEILDIILHSDVVTL